MEPSAPEDDDRRSAPERTLRGAGAFHLRFTLVHVSHHVSFHFFGRYTTAGCLLLVFHPEFIGLHRAISLDEGACCALWASRCDFWDPGWGDPGFPQRDVLLLHLLRASVTVMFSGLFVLHKAPISSAHKLLFNLHRPILST